MFQSKAHVLRAWTSNAKMHTYTVNTQLQVLAYLHYHQGRRRRGDAGYPSPRSRNLGGIYPALFKMDRLMLAQLIAQKI